MRTLNKDRAVLLTKLDKNPETEEETEEKMLLEANAMDCKFAVNGLAAKLLQGTFTCAEDGKCNQCTLSVGPNRIPIISTGKSFKQDFGNLVQAIVDNFPDNIC